MSEHLEYLIAALEPDTVNDIAKAPRSVQEQLLLDEDWTPEDIRAFLGPSAEEVAENERQTQLLRRAAARHAWFKSNWLSLLAVIIALFSLVSQYIR